jgi:rare lipoprotein A (peptidoglycan hydrolase)
MSSLRFQVRAGAATAASKACLRLTLALLLCAGCAKESNTPAAKHPESSDIASERGGPPNGCSPADLRKTPKRVLRGLATYYADSLAGNRTANGERYDPSRLSAAHLTLPFGTRLRVTRSDMRSSPVVCVRVNDRGPYADPSHILDLSRRAAERLRMLRKGIVPVVIEVL